jgi:thymidylate synthase ThyX
VQARRRSSGAIGVHKSVANRLLEPFMWHTVVVTATAWDNFFGLRCNPMAQPEIRVAAEAMHAAYGESEPRKVGDDEWHLPYIQDDERDAMPVETQIKVSAARCARVSYLTQNGVRDFEQDVQLYDRLTSATPMHASPLEHVATPYAGNMQSVGVASYWENHGMHLLLPKYGNLLGWHQHRFDVEVAHNYQAFA